MNEIEKAAMTALPTVLTIDASRLLIRLMFSSGLICSVSLDDREIVVPDGERLFDEVFERHQRLVEIADELRDVER